PPGSQVYFDLDNGQTKFTTLNDGGIWNVAPGAHVLHAYIGDVNAGQKIAGTDETYIAFSVSPQGTPYSLAGLAGSTPPVSQGIANVAAPVNAPPTDIQLFGRFVDDHDAAPSLAYTITGNTNPRLFSSTAIDNLSGDL